MAPDPLPRWVQRHVPDQTGRTAVITGANSGIGFETARGLAIRGAHVVMACRNAGKAEDARRRILRDHASARLSVALLDLSDLDSVARFADALAPGRLDLLILNAGVMALPFRESAQGHEMQFATNVLGHFALAARLAPRFLATPGSRTVWLSSLAHRFGRIQIDDLDGRRAYHPWRAYGQSKLADLMLALEMDRRLRAAGVPSMSVAAHPGFTATNLQFAAAEMTGSAVQRRLNEIFNRLFAMPAWQGALPTLVAATSSHVRPGDYIGPDGVNEVRGFPARARVSEAARNPAMARALWAACEQMAGVTFTVARAAEPA
ncbi:MAG: oxidoreductase [Rubricoccaceae bacterium]